MHNKDLVTVSLGRNSETLRVLSSSLVNSVTAVGEQDTNTAVFPSVG